MPDCLLGISHAYACLATRIPTGTTITAENLEKAEKAEGAVTKLGFKDFRVRIIGNTGKLQVKPEQMQKAIELRKEILEAEKGILDDVVWIKER